MFLNDVLTSDQMSQRIIIYINAAMQQKQTNLQPSPDETVFGTIHGASEYCKKRLRALGIAQDRIIYDRTFDDIHYQVDLYKRIITHGGTTFRKGPYNRFFVRRTETDHFRDEIIAIADELAQLRVEHQ